MSTIVLELPDGLFDGLRAVAEQNGRSVEAEALAVLSRIVDEPGPFAERADFDDRVRRAQATFASCRSPKVLASDELIAERRFEAWRETVEANDRLREHGDQTIPRSRLSRP